MAPPPLLNVPWKCSGHVLHGADHQAMRLSYYLIGCMRVIGHVHLILPAKWEPNEPLRLGELITVLKGTFPGVGSPPGSAFTNPLKAG